MATSKAMGTGRSSSDERDEKNAAYRDRGEERLGGKEFNEQSAEKGCKQHQRKRDAEHVPETPCIGPSDSQESLGPRFGDRDFESARERSSTGQRARRHRRSKNEDEEKHRGELE